MSHLMSPLKFELLNLEAFLLSLVSYLPQVTSFQNLCLVSSLRQDTTRQYSNYTLISQTNRSLQIKDYPRQKFEMFSRCQIWSLIILYYKISFLKTIPRFKCATGSMHAVVFTCKFFSESHHTLALYKLRAPTCSGHFDQYKTFAPKP